GTRKLGYLSLMVRRACAGVTASAAASATASTRNRRRTLDMEDILARKGSRSTARAHPQAKPSNGVRERSVPESGHYFLNEELEAGPVEGRAEGQDNPLGPRRGIVANALRHLERRTHQDARAHEVGHRAEHETKRSEERRVGKE